MKVSLSENEECMEHLPVFNLKHTLHELKHYLPAQAPLKDFIHHNTLHAFQSINFFDALRKASGIFGYRVTLSLDEFREKYTKNEISEVILDSVIKEEKGIASFDEWKKNVVNKKYDTTVHERIGDLRSHWKTRFDFDMDSKVHPIFFRIVCSYLDQGISIWDFPVQEQGFLASIKELERLSYSSFFQTKKVKDLLKKDNLSIEELLERLVGKESLYEQYLFDQQFSHQGWSGIISSIEDAPESLINTKKCLKTFVYNFSSNFIRLHFHAC